MPPRDTSTKAAPPISGKRTLQRLRREAGYRSARDFAAELGIPASTYSRYERQPEGPGMAVPLSAAWAIADRLGCSIDLVVGREDIDAPDEHPVQSRYDALSGGGRGLVDGFLDFVEQSEADGPRPQGRR